MTTAQKNSPSNIHITKRVMFYYLNQINLKKRMFYTIKTTVNKSEYISLKVKKSL